MGLTLEFIALFIVAVIPGFIFQRFYFYGQFSKQFIINDSILKSLVNAIIPSLLIHVVFLSILSVFDFEPFSIVNFIETYRQIASSFDGLSFEQLNDSIYSDFLNYIIWIYVLSILLGVILSRIVRFYNLDKKISILRYKNQWYYIFSGEIKDFKKFRSGFKSLNSFEVDKYKSDMVFADILVKSSPEPKLYTGFVVDYDLDSKDISKLDKVYLLDAYRYKNEAFTTKGGESKVISTKKKIPGEIFILPVSDMINMNLIYLSSKTIELESFLNDARRKLITISIILTFIILSLIISSAIFINYPWLDFEFYKLFFDQTNFFDRFIFFSIYTQILSVLMPTVSKVKKNKLIWFSNLRSKILLLLVLLGLFILLNMNWLFK